MAFHLQPFLYQRSSFNQKESTVGLKKWLREHKDSPYPSKPEKIFLAMGSGMTLTQVSTWFANARRRLKKESIETVCHVDDCFQTIPMPNFIQIPPVNFQLPPQLSSNEEFLQSLERRRLTQQIQNENSTIKNFLQKLNPENSESKTEEKSQTDSDDEDSFIDVCEVDGESETGYSSGLASEQLNLSN